MEDRQVSLTLVPLALLMWAVTYPSRAVPLFAPRLERLPRWLLAYLRLIAPAVLAALAASNSLVVVHAGSHRTLDVGLLAVGTAVCVAVTAWRHNLFVGMMAAIVLVSVARASGIA